jgi:site-specific recombinase XerD
MRKPSPLPKVLSREDAHKLLTSIRTTSRTGLRNRVALQLMYRAGLRVSEVCNLGVRHVDLRNGYVYVQQGKGKKDRYVPIDPETIQLCQQWLCEKPASDYFICTLKGGPVSQRYLRAVCYRLSQKAGVFLDVNHRRVPVHPHTLRHCYATERLEDGFDLREVQELLGHSSPNTTAIYTHIRPAKLRRKVQELPPIGVTK